MKKQKRQFRKPGRFPEGVARFFNPQKSGTNAEYDPTTGALVKPGTHQYQKMKERSYIPIRSTLK